ITRREFDDVMRTNVFGVMQWLPQLAPGLAARQGRAAFISSDMASIAECSSSHGMLYRASKAALNMVVKCAALEYPGARFLALSPGWVRTDMGGQEAPLSVEESVRGMLEVLSSLTPADSGSFLDHQRRNLPW
ncbi:MAG: SDR family oxidoreductase, partial [Planctomycetes bacterium]|nr:SDR family oxidoreductase [Planctomycetota bacterium]